MEKIQSYNQRVNNLIGWLNTFQIEAPFNTIKELKNGVVLVEVLMQIEPEWFTENWKEYVKIDKFSGRNLYDMQKIIDSVIEYYKDYLTEDLTTYYVTPNAKKITEECDAQEMYRLLQLILSCAVKCQRKNDYIEMILQTNPNVMLEMITDIQIRNFVCDAKHGTFLYENLPKVKYQNEKSTSNQKSKEITCDLCAIIVRLYSGTNTVRKWSNKYRQLQKKTLKVNQEKLSLMTEIELLVEQFRLYILEKYFREYKKNGGQSEKYTDQRASSSTKMSKESEVNYAKYIKELCHNKIAETYDSITKVMRDISQYYQENEGNVLRHKEILDSFVNEIESTEFHRIANSEQDIEKQESQLPADEVNVKTKTENINPEDMRINYIKDLETKIKDRDARLTEAIGENKDPLPENANKINEEEDRLSDLSDLALK